MDNFLLPICILCIVILFLIVVMKKLEQPYMVSYIMAGVVLGPYVTQIIMDAGIIGNIGEIGILLLMFFLGMEMEIPDSRSKLMRPLWTQVARLVLAVAMAFTIGFFFEWAFYDKLLLSLLFSFNSTAVVSEYLYKNKELHTRLGMYILNVLLFQDLLLAPVLTFFQFLGGRELSFVRLTSALMGCGLIAFCLRSIRHHDFIKPSFLASLKGDHELQIFLGGALCLGFGVLSEKVGLSAALGSFIAGMLIGRTESLKWLGRTLSPFRLFFVSLFFVSIGLRLDIPYIKENYTVILAGTLLLLLGNNILSALVFRFQGYSWPQSFYAGALLSQAGEFGILASTLAYQLHIVGLGFFRISIAITALSLLLSTSWVMIFKKIIQGFREDRLPLAN